MVSEMGVGADDHFSPPLLHRLPPPLPLRRFPAIRRTFSFDPGNGFYPV